jgi:hypothetical protein
MATSWPKSLNTIYGSADEMCKRIGQLTDGKFVVQTFAGGEIVGAIQVFDAVSNKTVECGHTLSAFYFGKDPIYAFDSGVAFGANARQQAAWLYYGGARTIWRASQIRLGPRKGNARSAWLSWRLRLRCRACADYCGSERPRPSHIQGIHTRALPRVGRV